MFEGDQVQIRQSSRQRIHFYAEHPHMQGPVDKHVTMRGGKRWLGWLGWLAWLPGWPGCPAARLPGNSRA